MTKRTRRKIDAALKAKIALEAMREQASAADLAQRYEADLCVEEAAAGRPSPVRSNEPGFKSRWMAAGDGWTTCSSSGCGALSSTKTSISRAMWTAAKQGSASPHGSPSTILHHNTHLSMSLKRIDCADRDVVPWGSWHWFWRA